MLKKLINPGLILIILCCWGWYFKLYAESPLFVQTEGRVIASQEVVSLSYNPTQKRTIERVSYTHQVEYEALDEVMLVQMTLDDGKVLVAEGASTAVFFNGSNPSHVRHASPKPNWVWAGMLTLILGFILLNRIYLRS